MVVSTLSAPSAATTERALARNGAEAILQLLVACGVEYGFWNPGTDTAPLAALRERQPLVYETEVTVLDTLARQSRRASS